MSKLFIKKTPVDGQDWFSVEREAAVIARLSPFHVTYFLLPVRNFKIGETQVKLVASSCSSNVGGMCSEAYGQVIRLQCGGPGEATE